jgi:hypothetical protein
MIQNHIHMAGSLPEPTQTAGHGSSVGWEARLSIAPTVVGMRHFAPAVQARLITQQHHR